MCLVIITRFGGAASAAAEEFMSNHRYDNSLIEDFGSAFRAAVAQVPDPAGEGGGPGAVLEEILGRISAGSQDLPNPIDNMVEMIKNHSILIQKNVEGETEKDQESFEAAFASVVECNDKATASMNAIHADTANSQKTLASKALDTLCTHRKEEAKLEMDLEGCTGQLESLKQDKNLKDMAVNEFIGKPSSSMDANPPTTANANTGTLARCEGFTNAADAETWLADSQTALSHLISK
jgi:hypothetical protein